MHFTKMHGAGNDYVYVDCFEQPVPAQPDRLAIELSDRHTGIGADGLILIHPSKLADARMQMFNADGSEAEMCGNGIRCVGKYLLEHGLANTRELRIETGRGQICRLHVDLSSSDSSNSGSSNGLVDRIRVEMGQPILEAAKIPTTLAGNPPVNATLSVAGRNLLVSCVSMGNPHCITFVDELTDTLVSKLGPLVETHAAFPNRTNVEFVHVDGPDEISMRVWERGTGETRACGSGACAAVVAGVITSRTERQVLVHLPGGDLEIEWVKSGETYLTGPAVEVFSGEWPDSL